MPASLFRYPQKCFWHDSSFCFWRFVSGLLTGILFSLLLSLFLSGCDAPGSPGKTERTAAPRQLGQALQVAATTPGAVLQSSQGAVPSGDLAGKVLLVSFGYGNCPDICPANLAINGQVLNQLEAAQREQVRVLMVSVDPARDTPEHLQRYLAFFHPAIIGLRVDEAALASLAKTFGAVYVRQDKADGNYSIDHTAQTFVLNRQGEQVQTLSFGASQEEVLAVLRGLL